MVYDPSSKRVILFGGIWENGVLNDTWAYDPAANNWVNLKPTGASPSPRWSCAMVYSPSTRQILMFGGCHEASATAANIPDQPSTYDDLWAYDSAHNKWTPLSPSGAHPTTRGGQSMACDLDTGQVIMFAGSNSGGDLNDTWDYTP